MNEPVKSWVLTAKTVDSILNYLASRPYMEVTALINQVSAELRSQLPPVESLQPVTASGDTSAEKTQETA